MTSLDYEKIERKRQQDRAWQVLVTSLAKYARLKRPHPENEQFKFWDWYASDVAYHEFARAAMIYVYLMAGEEIE